LRIETQMNGNLP